MAQGGGSLENRKFAVAFIIGFTLFTSYLHYSTIPKIFILHDIYRELYYIPVLFAALVFGLKGAILSFLLVVALYAPWMALHWTGDFIFEANRLVQLTFLGIVGFLAGVLINRDRRNREQMDKEHYLALIGQMASTIVHDLKNPLITILGFGRRYLEGKEDPENAMQYIMDAARAMLKIVHEVLDFAKPLQLDTAEKDIREVISQSLTACMTKAETDGVAISLQLPPEPIKASVDSFQLERALVNLVTNAIEASQKEQTVAVTVTSEKEYVMIAIKDDGAGMDRETANNIFIPFFTTKGEGTGLGMPIAKKIIEGHNGKIYIYSRPGEGTEAKIVLPLKGQKGR
ncbi:MAG: HAMP domain-containing sensor histidine kinase [Thermodesulfovibrionales bacterium]|jgi:signal transduction histidine kinase